MSLLLGAGADICTAIRGVGHQLLFWPCCDQSLGSWAVTSKVPDNQGRVSSPSSLPCNQPRPKESGWLPRTILNCLMDEFITCDGSMSILSIINATEDEK